jgi:hypothetical protein
MNNLSDEDPKLTNFLRQNRSIPPSELLGLEDRLISEIDLLPTEKKQRVPSSWWRYIAGGIGIIATGVIGVTIHQLMNPPESNLAQLNQLNLYIEAHIHSLVVDAEIGIEDHDTEAASDTDLFLDNDSDIEDI